MDGSHILVSSTSLCIAGFRIQPRHFLGIYQMVSRWSTSGRTSNCRICHVVTLSNQSRCLQERHLPDIQRPCLYSPAQRPPLVLFHLSFPSTSLRTQVTRTIVLSNTPRLTIESNTGGDVSEPLQARPRGASWDLRHCCTEFNLCSCSTPR